MATTTPSTTQPPSRTVTTTYNTVSVPVLDYDSVPTPIPGTRVIVSDARLPVIKYWSLYTLAGPLTAPFTAAAVASCRQLHFLGVSEGVSNGFHSYSITQGLDCASNLRAPAQNCMPGNDQALYAVGMVSSKTQIIPQAFFSPATGCPAGYATACTISVPTGIATKSNENAYACCPSGHQCLNDGCIYVPKPSETVSIASCGTLTATTVVWGPNIAGNVRSLPIRIIVGQDSDAPLPYTAAILSPGIQAAIGVSVTLACIILIIAGFLLIRRHRRRRKGSNATSSDIPLSELTKDEGDTVHETEADSKAIMGDNPKETKDNMTPMELDSSFVAELPGDEVPIKGHADNRIKTT